ncbi:MAG: adenine-specific methyltransferase EcoRI family protein [Candidatus Sungbacteria bacterium]|uniref:Adenine-specific methyltransferase EcoRI family protein n=1 Tax=Candidatus Sungiibacteriota bacterium TaxID=2750080 RepID=A0A9D6QVP0_9BACT|nr:adenine-specific methyltransferase EcoRI family protein [Candidatus Sungbacteria bacterium]
MQTKSLNKSLHKASQAKNDEFYTQLGDIANELKHYRDQLRGKVILCNCDDPFESNFFKYFAANFNTLGLKKLIATSYQKSPIVGGQLSLLDIEGLKPEGKEPYVVEINEVPDMNSDGAISLDDVEHLLKHNKNIAMPLKGGGDFRSKECIGLLKKADIVITNPPFSLFREFIAQLVEHNKKFLIIGSKNAITYKDIFKLIKEDKLWLGYGFASGNAFFKIPTEKAREFAAGVYDSKTGLVKFRNVGWFTNLHVDKSEDPITPYLTYEQGRKKGLYPKYDNYDAIEVSKVAEIPSDYKGVMGVPITFLDKWVPESGIEIVKFRKGNDDKDLAFTRERERERVQPYFRILIRYRRADGSH